MVHKVPDLEAAAFVDDGAPYPMLSDQAGAIGKMYGIHGEAAGVDIGGRFL